MSIFRVFVNDLSLSGFPDRESVRLSLNALLGARRNAPNLSRALYCSRGLTIITGASGETLVSAIQSFPRDEKLAILQWLAARGPFLEDEREPTEDDLYYYRDADVTDMGLGEAARQIQKSNDASAFSFLHGSGTEFSAPSLTVSQGLIGEAISVIDIPNLSNLTDLVAAANASVPEPASWVDLLTYCRDRYPSLLIGTHCDAVLQPFPFYPNVARRTIELLRVLDAISAASDPKTGSLTAEGEALRQSHFVGEKAWFTGESDDNERDFGNEMTFPDPGDPARKIRCFWHGKIKTPQFRIHFDWPAQPGNRLKIAYIGPKISKR
jgi:hypothetical protein